MIAIEKLEGLCDLIIDNNELTLSSLHNIGFNQYELRELIEREIIKFIEKGIYAFVDINKLYYYGKDFLSIRKIPEAVRLFYKCYKINPRHVKSCFQLFYSSIKKGQYYESLEYFEVFFSDGDSFIKTDSNLYLYLLSLIIEVPEKYKKHLLTLNYEALKIKPDDIRVKNLELENVVRKYIFENKFNEALEKLADDANSNELLPLQRTIAVNLLRQVIKNKEESAKLILSERISNEDEEKKKLRWLKSFMFDQRKYLDKRGISFLPEDESKKVMCLTDLMMEYYPQIEIILMNDGYNYQCVLRRIDASQNMAEIKEMMDLADQNFNLENFLEAKKIYLKLLRFEIVDPIVYERLGIIYSINPLTEKTPITFKFLDLAKYFYQKSELLEKERNVSFLIRSLKGDLQSDDSDESYDFEGKDDFAPIDIQKITDYMAVTGLDINTACEDFKFSGEEIGLVMLLYAKEYYSQGDFSFGNALMKTFEHSPNKTEATKTLYGDIMENRNYYASRRDPGKPRLTFVIKFKQNSQPK